MLFILIIIFISISFTYTNNLFRINNKLSILNEIKDIPKKQSSKNTIDFNRLLSDVLSTFYYNCSEDIKNMDSAQEGKEVHFPLLLRNIGLTLNDILDETECRESYNNTNYLIAVINVNYFSNKDD